MQDFRLMVNRSIRFALENDLTAKGSLVKLAQSMTKEYHLNFQHARTTTEVALSLGKGHRRRLRKGGRCKVPYVLADDAVILLYTPGSAGAHGVSGRPGSTGRVAIE